MKHIYQFLEIIYGFSSDDEEKDQNDYEPAMEDPYASYNQPENDGFNDYPGANNTYDQNTDGGKLLIFAHF